MIKHFYNQNNKKLNYCFKVSENGHKYSRIGKCSGHSSFVTHLDWSSNSEFLMSNSGDYEILYWQISGSPAPSCKQITQQQIFRDLEWSGNGGCTLTPFVMGIWATTSFMDGTDINSIAVSKQRGLCAYVDDFGNVNLMAYPAASVKAEKQSYRGHSSHVTNVTFVNDDSRLVTCGGNDMSVFQWALVTP